MRKGFLFACAFLLAVACAPRESRVVDLPTTSPEGGREVISETQSVELPEGRLRIGDVLLRESIARGAAARLSATAPDDDGCVSLRLPPATDAGDFVDRFERALVAERALAVPLDRIAGAPPFRAGLRDRIDGIVIEPAGGLRICPEQRQLPTGVGRLVTHDQLMLRGELPPFVAPVSVRDARQALQRGYVDAAIVDGVAASELRDAGLAVDLLPSFGRVWTLVANPKARWLIDPTLRRWVREVVQTGVRANALGWEEGRACRTLACDPSPFDGPPPPPRRPLGRQTSPRVDVAFDERDAAAERLASRVVALLLDDGWSPRLAPVSLERLREDLDSGSFDFAIWPHGERIGDALFDALETDVALGPAGAPTRELLIQADPFDEPEMRERGWRAAARTRREFAAVVPLLREERYLVRRPEIPPPCVVGPGERLAWCVE